MRKAKIPCRIQTVNDLLSLDEWHYLSQNLAAQEPRAAYAIVIIREKSGDLIMAGTTVPIAEAILMLKDAEMQILDYRERFNA